MLVLTRKVGEAIVIDSGIVVTVLDLRGNKVRLGIKADEDISVNRSEVQEVIDTEFPNEWHQPALCCRVSSIVRP